MNMLTVWPPAHNHLMKGGFFERLFAKFSLAGEPSFVHLNIEKTANFSQKYPNVPAPESKLSIKLLAAEWASHGIYGEDMPQVAANLLEAGYDSPSLRRLAGEMRVTCSADVEDLVRRTFRELGVPYPLSEKQAKLIVTRQVARLVIAGEYDPERAGTFLEIQIWGWSHETEDLSRLFALNDELTWSPEHRRPVALVRDDLVDAFARLALCTDEQIFAPDSSS